MIDIAAVVLVVASFAFITAAVSSRFGRATGALVWLAFAEYSGCAIVQFFFGVDADTYRLNGLELAQMLDLQFNWISGELVALLFHRPSFFDNAVTGAGTNTGSMSAAAAWFTFLMGGSTYAAHALVAGLSMVSTFALFDVLRDECPHVPPQRIFAAVVLFPSIAFWSAAFHKESFCLMGTALAACSWRAARQRKIRAIPYGIVGLTTIALFRAPALPPLLLGLTVYFIVERVQKAQGAEVGLVGPMNLAIGVVVLGAGMVGITRLAPGLGLENLGEIIAHQQQSWAAVEGGSSFEVEAPVERSLAAQLVMAPLGLVNALLRPQLFDVRNPLMLVSALEMTFIAVLLFRALKLHGGRGLLRHIQSSPIAVLCAVVTLIGCTFVGLTTLNFGSLARYRSPFLPFYGCLLAIITTRSPGDEQAAAARPKVRRRASPNTLDLPGRMAKNPRLYKR